MKAISIIQPFASLIVTGIKPIENRTWKTNIRERVFIHSSKSTIHQHVSGVLDFEQLKDLGYQAYKKGISGQLLNIHNWPLGAIIGEVTIVDCVQNHHSVWAEENCWNWVLEDPVMYEKPIYNVKGKLSFWEFEKPI